MINLETREQRHFRLLHDELIKLNPDYRLDVVGNKSVMYLDFSTHYFQIAADYRNRAVVNIYTRIKDNWAPEMVVDYSYQITNFRRFIHRKDKKSYAKDIDKIIRKHIKTGSFPIQEAMRKFDENLDRQIVVAEIKQEAQIDSLKIEHNQRGKDHSIRVFLYPGATIDFHTNDKIRVQLGYNKEIDHTNIDPAKGRTLLNKVVEDLQTIEETGYTTEHYEAGISKGEYSWNPKAADNMQLIWNQAGTTDNFQEVHEMIKKLNTGRAIIRKFMTGKMKNKK